MNINMIKEWGGEIKMKARRDTIINNYKKIFNLDSIPSAKQYISMAGLCATTDGKIQNESEYMQMINSDFVKEGQFYGIDYGPKVIELNKMAYPEANWVNDDIFWAIREMRGNGVLNPAIINLDTIHKPEKALIMFSNLIQEFDFDNLLVVINMVIRNKNVEQYTVDDIVQLFLSDRKLNRVKSKWKLFNEGYKYHGQSTEMFTLVWYRHDNEKRINRKRFLPLLKGQVVKIKETMMHKDPANNKTKDNVTHWVSEEEVRNFILRNKFSQKEYDDNRKPEMPNHSCFRRIYGKSYGEVRGDAKITATEEDVRAFLSGGKYTMAEYTVKRPKNMPTPANFTRIYGKTFGQIKNGI